MNVKFETDFCFGQYKGQLEHIRQMVKECVLSKENLYISVEYHKTRRNSSLLVELDLNATLDIEKFMRIFEPCKVTSSKSTGFLDCIFDDNLLSKEIVEMLVKKYNISHEMYEIPYDEGDDYNFISATPYHFNAKFDKIVFSIEKPHSNPFLKLTL
jgi:hypothetical protein